MGWPEMEGLTMSKFLVFICSVLICLGAVSALPARAEAACGALNQSPSTIFQRIPSCDAGLYEDFGRGLCLRKARVGVECGALNTRPCTIFERIPSCNAGLYEDFLKGQCLRKAVVGVECGPAGKRPCTILERIPSCNPNLIENFATNRCQAVACGKDGGRPCTIVERIPSCDQGLTEDFTTNTCIPRTCGKLNNRPCTIVERIPSCDPGLVEMIFKGRCVPSGDADKYATAQAKLKSSGAELLGAVGIAGTLMSDQRAMQAVSVGDPLATAAAVRSVQTVDPNAGTQNMPHRTVTIGLQAGVRFIFVGASGSAGVSIDMAHRMPVYAFASGDYSWGPGLGAGGGIDIGFWVCRNDQIHGEIWGIEFGLDDFVTASKLASSFDAEKVKEAFRKVGPSFNVALCFNDDHVYQGMTLTPGAALGIDFGGVMYAGTVADGDRTLQCDGTPHTLVSAANQIAPEPVQEIALTGGKIVHGRIDDTFLTQDEAAVGVLTPTGSTKSLLFKGAHAGVALHAVPGRGAVCHTFPSVDRVNFDLLDGDTVVKTDAMSMGFYAGDVVVFDWRGN